MTPGPYTEAVQFLYALQGFGVKLGLENMRKFLAVLGHPEKKLSAIHIAGTNGKGSTAAMLASILTEAGLRTGLYASPHLVDYRERFRIDGSMIPRSFVSSWVGEHRRWIVRKKLTFFETTTAMAFDWFVRAGVDLAVIETGLGGRLDATNVLSPLATIITSISREHTHILGNTTRNIATEKAGILRHHVPCVCGVTSPGPRSVIRRMCREIGAPFIPADEYRIRIASSSLSRLRVGISGPDISLHGVRVALGGAMQARNLSAVFSAVGILRSTYGIDIDSDAVRLGLSRISENTGLRGRFTLVRRKPALIVDVAHNPGATESLTESLMKQGVHSCEAVFGVSEDKDHAAMLRSLRRVAARVTVVRPRTFRGRSVGSIMDTCAHLGIKCREGGTVAQGLKMVLRERSRRPVLVTGSHFVAGEALAMLERRKYLTISQ